MKKAAAETRIPLSSLELIHSFGVSSRCPLLTVRHLLIVERLKDKPATRHELLEYLNVSDTAFDQSITGILRDSQGAKTSWKFVARNQNGTDRVYSLTPEGRKWLKIL